MRTLCKFGFKLLAVLGLGSFASLAAAGGSGGVITYGPVGGAAAIPTISGSLLIALAVVLMLVAFRLLKDRPHTGTKLVIAVAAIAALATGAGAGGIKLVADAHATVTELNMQDDDGGTLIVPGNGQIFKVFNRTSVTQEIKKIEAVNCGDNGGLNGALPLVQTLNGGQSSKGTCAVSTRLAPDTEYCEISFNCFPGT